MKLKRILTGLTALTVTASAMAQSDGGRFDAAIVLSPGMWLERGGVLAQGNFQSGLLQHGDVIYTDNLATGPFYILTSDGSVIAVNGATTLTIDGNRIGFDVFQVANGSASLVGNVNNGFVMPSWFATSMPLRVGNVVIAQPNVPPMHAPRSSFVLPNGMIIW